MNTRLNCRGRGMRDFLFLLLSLTLTSAPAFSSSLEVPSGAQVVAGTVSIASQTGALAIHQSSNKAIVNWQSFNIGKDAAVNVHQPGVDAALLNRVLSSDPSRILGSLKANGQVFLVNPNGVIFGQGARVDVGGLVASALDIQDTDFLNDQYQFAGGGSGDVVNQGLLRGGFIALLAPGVKNQGTIEATLSDVALASGDQATLTFRGQELIGLSVDPATLKSLIDNQGALIASNGAVLLKAAAAKSLVDNLIKSQTQATGLVAKDGAVQLVKAGGRINAKSIEIDAGAHGSALISGVLNARGDRGGQIRLAGLIELTPEAIIDAHGGEIILGGAALGRLNKASDNSKVKRSANAEGAQGGSEADNDADGQASNNESESENESDGESENNVGQGGSENGKSEQDAESALNEAIANAGSNGAGANGDSSGQAPGNSGQNNNSISGVQGNQGNDKPVGNAGGAKSGNDDESPVIVEEPVVITPPVIVEEPVVITPPVIVEEPVVITPPVIVGQPGTPQSGELAQQGASQVAAFISSIKGALNSSENSPSESAGAAAFVSALRGTEQPPIAALGGLVGGSVQPQAQGSAPKSADSGEDDQ